MSGKGPAGCERTYSGVCEGGQVAVKVLRREITGIFGSGRFGREIRILQRLKHPSIVPVLDSHESPTLHYYVMPYVPGESLRDRLVREGPLPLDGVLSIAKALADRLAEAFAERLHERVRREFWGYAKDETLTNEDIIKEGYRGIRPAPGYPACPEHTEKAALWALLDAEKNAGIKLTESYAMWPGAAVSGWYFSHPQSQYFVVGRFNKDQIADYARRKGWSLSQAEKWLAPNLGYEPED